MTETKKGDKYDFMAKVIIIGDSGIGKTVLITRFCEDTFKQSYVATIGVDFKVKNMTIHNTRSLIFHLDIDCRYGIPLVRKGSKTLLKHTIREQQESSSPIPSSTELHSKVSIGGSAKLRPTHPVMSAWYCLGLSVT